MQSPSTYHHRRSLPHDFALPTLLILLCLAVSARTGLAAGAPDGSESPLAGTPALEPRITLSEPRISLDELIQKVAEQADASLRAAPDAADEPVAVVVTDVQARELLEQLAELLDYRRHRSDMIR